MIELILIISIFIFMAVLSFKNKSSLVAPGFIYALMMAACFIIMLLNYNNWEVNINSGFVMVLFVGSIAFVVSTNICTRRFYPKAQQVNSSRFPYILYAIISAVLFGLYMLNTLKYVSFNGNIGTFLREIYENKKYFTHGNPIYNQYGKAIMALSYISLFQLFNIVIKIKENRFSQKVFLLLVPIGISLLYALIATDRNVLIRFFIYGLCLWIMLYTQRDELPLKSYNKQVLKQVVFATLGFAVLFYFSGKIKLYQSDFGRMISIYAGSGLNNTNIFIGEFKSEWLYGQNTFYSVISVFQRFGLFKDIKVIDPVEYPGYIRYVAANGYIYASNVYSAFQAYYNDWGILGVIVLTFIQGIFFGYLFKKASNTKDNLAIIMYAFFLNSIVYIPIMEQFYSRIHFGLVYELIWMMVFYLFAYKRGATKTNLANRRELARNKS